MPRASGPSPRDYAADGGLALLLAMAVTFQDRDSRERFRSFVAGANQYDDMTIVLACVT